MLEALTMRKEPNRPEQPSRKLKPTIYVCQNPACGVQFPGGKGAFARTKYCTNECMAEHEEAKRKW